MIFFTQSPRLFSFLPIYNTGIQNTYHFHFYIIYDIKALFWALTYRPSKQQLPPLPSSSYFSLSCCWRFAATSWENGSLASARMVQAHIPTFGSSLLSFLCPFAIIFFAPYYHYIYRILFHTLLIRACIPFLFEKGHSNL